MDVGAHEEFSGHLQSELPLKEVCCNFNQSLILPCWGEYLASHASFDSGWEEVNSPVRGVGAGLVNLKS